MIGLRCLVLNADYSPISLIPFHHIPVEDAVTRVFNQTCHVVESYNKKILSPSVKMNWPSVIARNEQLKKKDIIRLRRESLFYRDHGLCSYCEEPITISGLTYDHVVPRRHGGTSDWTNIVCACSRCNSLKGDKLPVGDWKPRQLPYRPTYYELLGIRRKFPVVVDDKTWIPFLGEWKAPVLIKGG
jgi:5-methylcytosine-specific restriction endonuclease McrA